MEQLSDVHAFKNSPDTLYRYSYKGIRNALKCKCSQLSFHCNHCHYISYINTTLNLILTFSG